MLGESLCILCKLRWPSNGDNSSHALNRIFILCAVYNAVLFFPEIGTILYTNIIILCSLLNLLEIHTLYTHNYCIMDFVHSRIYSQISKH